MKRHGLAGENGLRVLRRRFLRAALRRSGGAAIATAHTADDQLETVLMRLLRGAGLRGLGGMRDRLGPWFKPLLEATRLEIVTDLRAAQLEWREDRSNGDPAWTRNRIRHGAVPALLRALDPELDGAPARAALARRVAAAAREARDAERALGAWLASCRPAVSSRQGNAAMLEAGRLAAFPIAARRMALRRAWRLVAPAGVGLTRRHMAALCNLVGASRPRSLDLPAGVRAERDRDAIRLIMGRAEKQLSEPIIGQRPRAAGGRRPAGPSGAWGEP
jgi:tRNA(Ile)-lysidine synthase